MVMYYFMNTLKQWVSRKFSGNFPWAQFPVQKQSLRALPVLQYMGCFEVKYVPLAAHPLFTLPSLRVLLLGRS